VAQHETQERILQGGTDFTDVADARLLVQNCALADFGEGIPSFALEDLPTLPN
jgi:hypothetical protein